MNPLMEQLHDIDGLDPISFWPLAPGWWALIALGVIILAGVLWFTVKTIRFRRSWKNDTLQKLKKLEDDLSEANARQTVIALSEYLRRIALRRFSRKECAGLMGEAWLEWLSSNDPQKIFDWTRNGVLLIEVPYAPDSRPLPEQQIKEMIHAAREWVH